MASKESFPPIHLKKLHIQIYSMRSCDMIKYSTCFSMNVQCVNIRNMIHCSVGNLLRKYESHHYNSLGDDTACVFLWFQIWFLYWFHLLFLGFCLHKMQQKQLWNTMFCYKFQPFAMLLMSISWGWALVPCHFWHPWSGQRWHILVECTDRWGVADQKQLAPPSHNWPSTQAEVPQLGLCGNI